MNNPTTSTVEQRVRDLQDYIAQGRIVDALHEFYAPDVVMQENLNEPTVGREANIAREKAWLASVKEFKAFDVHALAAEADHSFVESSLAYVDQDGNEVRSTQVARAVWKDGRIVAERFYHG